jgi:hypothetical protein
VEIVSINKNAEKHKKELLEVIDVVKAMIESGEIDEFVMASSSQDGAVQIHASIKDALGGVGLFEIGKRILIDQQINEML